jgi:hypothetical protein
MEKKWSQEERRLGDAEQWADETIEKANPLSTSGRSEDGAKQNRFFLYLYSSTKQHRVFLRFIRSYGPTEWA